MVFDSLEGVGQNKTTKNSNKTKFPKLGGGVSSADFTEKLAFPPNSLAGVLLASGSATILS